MKRIGKGSLERWGGRAIMALVKEILKESNSTNLLLSQFEDKYSDEELEKSVAYQVLKTGAQGLQRTLDEMNDVLEKFGFKE